MCRYKYVTTHTPLCIHLHFTLFPIHRDSSFSGSLNSVRGDKSSIDQLGLCFKCFAISTSKYLEFCTYAGLSSIHLKQCKGIGTMNGKDRPQCDTCWNLRK